MNERGWIKALERAKEKALCDVLAKAEAGDPAALDAWLQATPEYEANAILLRLARASTPSHEVNGWMWLLPLGTAFWFYSGAQSFLHGKDIAMDAIEASLAIFVFGTMSLARFGRLLKRWRFRFTRYAVVVLAERGDERALPLLAAEWQHRPHRSRRVWNEQMAAALTQLLDCDKGVMPTYGAQDKLRSIGERLLFRRRFRRTGDLTVTEAYLAIAIVRCLHRARGLGNIEFVARVARLPRRVVGPNEALVREIAETLALSGRPTPARAEAAVPTAVVPPQMAQPIVQATRRS